MTLPAIGSVPISALPPPRAVLPIDSSPISISDWRLSGFAAIEDPAAGRRPRDFRLLWELPIEGVHAIRGHRAQHAYVPFTMTLLGQSEIVEYTSPLSIDWISNRFARVEVTLSRALP